MRKEIIETGKSVDAAINAACEKLGCERDNCEWEIMDLPRKGFLGLKTFPARVRVSIEVPDEKPAPKVQTPRPAPKAAEPKSPKTAASAKKPAPRAPRPPRQRIEDNEPVERIPVTENFTEKETLAMDYVSAILADFGLTSTLELVREGSGICVNITGEGLGSIIGRRGETLDAIQYLTGLVANRLEGDYLRVTVDCGDYRTKRKETLEALANKLAAQVLKTNVSKTLEPMNPFERRVIHATVSEIEGVSSASIGEEPNRRVVITSPTARRAPARGGSYNRDSGSRDRRPPRSGGYNRDRSEGDRYSGSRGGDRDRRSSNRGPRPAPAPIHEGPPKETPESATFGNAPIGKLDLE